MPNKRDKLNPGCPRYFSFNNISSNYKSNIFTLEIIQNTEKYNDGKTHYLEINTFHIWYISFQTIFKLNINVQNCTFLFS